jgi:ribosomal 50S subunit-recycling heat shock protein
MKALSAIQLLNLLWAARFFGRNRAWAKDALLAGDIQSARNHAKNARENWQTLKSLLPENIRHLIK